VPLQRDVHPWHTASSAGCDETETLPRRLDARLLLGSAPAASAKPSAPMPRESPVMSATFPSSFFDIVRLLEFRHMLIRHEPKLIARPRHPITSLDCSSRQ